MLPPFPLQNFGLPVCSFDFGFEDGNTLLTTECLLEPGMSPKQMERTVESAVRAAVAVSRCVTVLQPSARNLPATTYPCADALVRATSFTITTFEIFMLLHLPSLLPPSAGR